MPVWGRAAYHVEDGIEQQQDQWSSEKRVLKKAVRPRVYIWKRPLLESALFIFFPRTNQQVRHFLEPETSDRRPRGGCAINMPPPSGLLLWLPCVSVENPEGRKWGLVFRLCLLYLATFASGSSSVSSEVAWSYFRTARLVLQVCLHTNDKIILPFSSG